MAKNDYLARQRAREQKILDIGEDFGFQKCWDYLQLALRDPEVVGKGHEWGHDKILRLYKGIDRQAKLWGDAFSMSPEADYLQEKLDDNLREIWGDELHTFRERYEYIKQEDYTKAKKEWVK